MKTSLKCVYNLGSNRDDMNNAKGKLKALDRNIKYSNLQVSTTVKKMKRFRSAFTTEQVTYLEKEFRKYPYVGNSRRKDVASVLNIPERAVKIWFQNRRMKEKKDIVTKDSEGDSKRKADIMVRSFFAPIKDQALSLPLLTTSEMSENSVCVTNGNAKMEVEAGRSLLQENKIDSGHLDSMTGVESLIDPECISNPKNDSSTEINSTENITVEHVSDQSYSAHSIEGATNSKAPNKFEHHNHIQFYSSNAALPQDLSFCRKTDQNPVAQKLVKHSKEPAPCISSGISSQNIGSPVYMSGYYSQPYMPPGNMIWKPINVAPMMTTGLSAEGASTNGPPVPYTVPIVPQNFFKVNCNCDCHLKTYSPFLISQNDPNHLMQYFITAVPLSGHTSV